MSIELITVALFGGIVVGLIFGLPVAFVLGGISVLFTLFIWGPSALPMVAYKAFGWATEWLIIAVPLFIFMGIMLERSGIAERLFEMVHVWSGKVRGGLAFATIIICVLVAAMTGLTATATVSMGIVALPAMLRRGYDKKIAVGVIAASGTLGIIIPPSVMSILFGLVSGVSIGKLFAAGIVPGIVIGFIFALYVAIRAFLKPELAPASTDKYSMKDKITSLLSIIPPVLLIIGVLGSIFAGAATPTEAASVGALGSLLCCIGYRKFTWEVLKDTCYRTILLSGMVVWILIGASAFVGLYAGLGASDFVGGIISGLELNRWIIVILMLAILFILGCFLDPGALILLFAPIFVPIIEGLGFDLLWFGILFIISLQIGYLTPPFGFNLFYMKSVCPEEISIGDIYLSIIPFVILFVLSLIVFMVFPQLITWMPSVLFP